jgi:Family of unknown function (DUF5990)
MPQLPDRPDIDQLRRQARELHRAAQAGDAAALRRLRPVSDKVTLSTAQLALAREYGFRSWRRLRDEVEHRRTLPDGPVRDAPGPVPLPPVRRAYDESVAPPPTSPSPSTRRPARRPAPVLGTLTVLIDGFDLPGLTCHPEPDGTVHRSVHVALTGQDAGRPYLDIPGRGGARALEPVPGDAPSARWEVPVTVRRGDDGLDFSGPFVRGVRDDRHLGLAWGDVPGDGTLRLFRGAKLRLVDVEPSLIEAAMRPGQRLVARVRLTGPRGNPICARVNPPYIEWSAEPCG